MYIHYLTINNNQIEIIKKVANEYIDKKLDRLNDDERFAQRFNLAKMAENIECELVNKRSHVFTITKEQTIDVITKECENMLRKLVEERGI